MTSSEASQERARRDSVLLAIALVSALLLSVLPLQVFAQEGGTAVGPYIVTLQPGETIEIEVYGFCMDYGLPFPGTELTPIELAEVPLRNAAIYSLATDYVNTNPYDVQKAVWNLSDGTRLSGEDYTLADEIIAYANSGVQPSDVVSGVPHMVEKVNDGTLQADVADFVNISTPETGAWYGSGTLMITNGSDAAQQFVISYGTVGLDEAPGDQQNMLVFPSEPAPTLVPPTGGLLPPVGVALVAFVALGLAGLAMGRLRSRKPERV